MIFRSDIEFLAVVLTVSGSCVLGCKSTTSNLKLVIDHDGGADDAMAIFIVLLHEQYFNGPKVVGITTNHGNVCEEQAFINTQRILDVVNRRDIPIFRGANASLISDIPTEFFGKDGLGESSLFNDYEPLAAESEQASFALIRLSQQYKGYLTVLALGPLTNIAIAMLVDPSFIGRLQKLTIGAGNIYGKDFPDPEFNANMDVEAYAIVAKNSLPHIVTLVTFSQSYLNITNNWRLNKLGSIDTIIMKAQNAFEDFSIKNSLSQMWNRLDPLAAAITLDRSLAKEVYYVHNDIILCGEHRGIQTNRFEARNCNMQVLKTVDVAAYKKFLVEIFCNRH